MAVFPKPGTVLKTLGDRELQIVREYESGGRYSSYEVTAGGEPKILRWYTGSPVDGDLLTFWNRMKAMAESGDPVNTPFWPEDITEFSQEGFGLVIRELPEGSFSFRDLLCGKAKLSSYRQMADIAIHLISVWHRLLEAGYCCADHPCDFYIQRSTGNVFLGDIDKCILPGEEISVMENRMYLSPERVLGEGTPGMYNDRFVLGIYLFELFCGTHPLCGKKSLIPLITPETERKLFGSEALFLFDPEDDSNGPVPGIHQWVVHRWERLPENLKQLFCRHFGREGLEDPDARPADLEWLQALLRFRGSLLSCSCGYEWLAGNQMNHTCEKCGKTYTVPLQIVLGDYSRPAIRGARIFSGQVGPCSFAGAMTTVAQVVEKNGAPGVLGLQNRTGESWTVTAPGRDPYRIEPGKVVHLKAGITIRIGQTEVRIEESKE